MLAYFDGRIRWRSRAQLFEQRILIVPQSAAFDRVEVDLSPTARARLVIADRGRLHAGEALKLRQWGEYVRSDGAEDFFVGEKIFLKSLFLTSGAMATDPLRHSLLNVLLLVAEQGYCVDSRRQYLPDGVDTRFADRWVLIELVANSEAPTERSPLIDGVSEDVTLFRAEGCYVAIAEL